jgi:hypothetical protein
MSSVGCLGLHNNNTLVRSSHWQGSIKPYFDLCFLGEEARKHQTVFCFYVLLGRGKEGRRMDEEKSGETKEEED